MSDRATRMELERLRARCAQLQARCSELEPDATRYRALRDIMPCIRGVRPVVVLIGEDEQPVCQDIPQSVRHGLQLDVTLDHLAGRGTETSEHTMQVLLP